MVCRRRCSGISLFFSKALSGWIAGIGGAVGSLYTAAAGFTVLTGAVGVSGALSLVSYDVQISRLTRFG